MSLEINSNIVEDFLFSFQVSNRFRRFVFSTLILGDPSHYNNDYSRKRSIILSIMVFFNRMDYILKIRIILIIFTSFMANDTSGSTYYLYSYGLMYIS